MLTKKYCALKKITAPVPFFTQIKVGVHKLYCARISPFKTKPLTFQAFCFQSTIIYFPVHKFEF